MPVEQLVALAVAFLGSNLLSSWVTAKYASKKTDADAAATAAGEWQKLYLQQRKENAELRVDFSEMEAEIHRLEGENDALRSQLIRLEARLAKLENGKET